MQTTALVTQIRQVTTVQPNGTFKTAYSVTFGVGAQGPFTIQIPSEQFTAAEVKKQTEAFAAELAQIPMAEG